MTSPATLINISVFVGYVSLQIIFYLCPILPLLDWFQGKESKKKRSSSSSSSSSNSITNRVSRWRDLVRSRFRNARANSARSASTCAEGVDYSSGASSDEEMESGEDDGQVLGMEAEAIMSALLTMNHGEWNSSVAFEDSDEYEESKGNEDADAYADMGHEGERRGSASCKLQ